MAHNRVTLPLLVCILCFISHCSACPRNIRQTLDLSQLPPKWHFAGTPKNLNLSDHGRLLVNKTMSTECLIKFRRHCRKGNMAGPVVFKMKGKIGGNHIVTHWRTLGSRKKFGPFYHVIISVKYDSAIGTMLVCTKTKRYMENKSATTWSRERCLPILEELKSTLGAYVNQEIRTVDHGNC